MNFQLILISKQNSFTYLWLNAKRVLKVQSWKFDNAFIISKYFCIDFRQFNQHFMCSCFESTFSIVQPFSFTNKTDLAQIIEYSMPSSPYPICQIKNIKDYLEKKLLCFSAHHKQFKSRFSTNCLSPKKYTPSVNFTNILQAAFLYKHLLSSFFVLTAKVCIFLAKEIGAKAACKMLVKLTTKLLVQKKLLIKC